MLELCKNDLDWALRKIPNSLKYQIEKDLKYHPYLIAGGFIRSCVSGERINDIDVFTHSKEAAQNFADKFCSRNRQFVSENAISFNVEGSNVQVIYKWTFNSPEEIIAHFDFTIAQAVLWCIDKNKWNSMISDNFYQDLAAKRLVYTNPDNPEAGGSMLRMIKFVRRGYNPTLTTIAQIIGNLAERPPKDFFDKLKEVDPSSTEQHGGI